MNYIETAFDAIFLVFMLGSGFVLLLKARTRTEWLMGPAVLSVGLGSALLLGVWAVSHFSGDLPAGAFGTGRLISAISLPVFYVLMFYIRAGVYSRRVPNQTVWLVWLLAAVSVIACMFPQNHFWEGDFPKTWAVIRLVPQALLGLLVIFVWFERKHKLKRFRFVWILMLLALLLYIPAELSRGYGSKLYFLLIPCAVCYMLLAALFINAVLKPVEEEKEHVSREAKKN
ncbi:MAG: hypothetical protein K6F68_06160 [Clostridiales bacterium]|nr:hypothetical protein [Clostridiales bacterium]